MKNLLAAIFCLSLFWGNAQDLKHRVVWFLPAHATVVHGVAIGPVFEGPDYYKSESSKAVVNGLAIEVIGYGILMPMMPKSPFFPIDTAKIDSVLYGKNHVKKGVNGLMVSPGGFALNANINGINLSGIGTSTAQTNGFSMAIIGTHFRANGLTVHGFNEAVRLFGGQVGLLNKTFLLKGFQLAVVNRSEIARGVQVGHFNKTDQLKGFQFGLWNINGKRAMPIINWRFKK